MKKTFFSALMLLSCYTQSNAQEYYEKHLEFPPQATVEEKIDMASRLVPTPQQLEWQQMELTAFLHFDMDNLGGVDISVKMLQKNVSANWYLEDADSLTLLEENMHLLTERLEKKGYTCSMKLEQDAKKIDFVEDFLKADQKSSGEVHRYSFDVRA